MTAYVQGGPKRFDHQRRGLAKMISTGGVTALLFDPGTGKTAVVIDYAGLLALKSDTGEARVLVVAPLVAIDTWVSEAVKFASPQVSFWAEALGGRSIKEKAATLAARGPLGTAPQRPRTAGSRANGWEQAEALAVWDMDGNEAHSVAEGPEVLTGPRVVLCVINIDMTSSRTRVGSKTMADVVVAAVRRFSPDLVVMDESHKIKSGSGNASRVMGRIAKYVKRRAILTGTVMPHGPLDVYGQWRFLAPTAFGPLHHGKRIETTLAWFKERFIIYGGYYGREIIGYQHLDTMQAIMAEHAVVARKGEVLDLPPTTEVEVPVHLSPDEAAAYADMKDTLAHAWADGSLATAPNRLAQMMRLRQITSGHLPDDGGTTRQIGDAKARTVASIVNDTLLGEPRVVVFCLFSHEIAALSASLSTVGTEVLTITGSTTPEDRLLMRKRFGSDEATRLVMVAQVKTMSLAVNELVSASHAVFGSLSYQRDDYEQAKARLDRQGQTKPVTFWIAVAPGTVDEVILKAHRDRADLEDAMLNHVRSTGGGA